MNFSKRKMMKRAMSLVLSLLMAFSALMPAFAAEDEFAKYIGEVASVTKGLTVSESGATATATNKNEITLDFVSDADISPALNVAARRAIVSVDLSDELTPEMLLTARYYLLSGEQWQDQGLVTESELYNSEDGTFIVSLAVTVDDLSEEKLSVSYGFDWDSDGTESTMQTVTINLDTSKIKLVHTAGCSESLGALQVDPTCEEVGYTAYTYCPYCGLNVQPMEEIPALGHKFDEKIITDEHFKSKADGKSQYYYNCSREDCDEISTDKFYDVYESDYDAPFGSAAAITGELKVSGEGTREITVVNEKELTLDFSPMDKNIGRYMDAWWAGVTIYAPEGMSEAELEKVYYRVPDGEGWSAARSFWQNKDSKVGAERHFITVWVPVTPDYIARELKTGDGYLTSVYEFDWDANGFGISTQVFTIKVDVNKVKLVHNAGCTEVVEKEAVAPDCENPGNEKGSYCSVCGLVIGSGKTIPALGHVYTQKIVDDAHLEKEIDAEKSSYYFDCSRENCDAMSTDETFYVYEENLPLLAGSAAAITGELKVSGEGTREITVVNEKELTLDFSPMDKNIGRYMDAWWAGVTIYAPEGMSEAELEKVYYRVPDGEGWSAARSFWQNKDSKVGAERHFITVWVPVTPDYIARELKTGDGYLTAVYEFDWDANGFGISTQVFTIQVDVNKVKLVHNAGCTEVIEKEAVAPDCENPGNEKGSYCSVCGLVIGSGETIPALGHKFDEKIINDEHFKSKSEGKSEYYYNCSRENCDTISTEDTYFLDEADYSTFGTAAAITGELEISGEGTREITVVNEKELTLDFSPMDKNIGRYMDAWWAGVTIYAPEGMSEAELEKVYYRVPDGEGWSAARSFWQNKDSKVGAERHFITVWVPVTPDYIARELTTGDGYLTSVYEFDWDANGFGISTQVFTIKVDVNNVKLVHNAGCTEVIEKEAVAPDCENPGNEKGSYCSVCGLVIGSGKTIPALGHKFDEKIINDEHFKSKSEGKSEYYYNCSRENCDTISTEDTYFLNEADYSTFGTAAAITGELEISGEGTREITVINEKELTLDFSPMDKNIGRYMDAWWAGVTIYAPEGMSEAELEKVYYRVPDGEGWSAARSFWQNKDSKVGAERHFITVWVPVTPDYIARELTTGDGYLTAVYEFDWDANGFGISTQVFTIKVDVNNVKLVHNAGCTEVIDVAAVEPTCTQDGNTKASHCSVCGLILSESTVIPSFGGHDFTEEIFDDEHLAAKADCVYYDRYYYDCSRCDEIGTDTFEDKVNSELLDHDFKEKILDEAHFAKKADCTHYDIYYYDCTRCDEIGAETFEDTENSTLLPHEFKEKIIDENHLAASASCTHYDLYYYSCISCDVMGSETFEDTEGSVKLEHQKIRKIDEIHLVSKATCTEPAKYAMGCRNCDEVFADEIFEDGQELYHLFTIEKVIKKSSPTSKGYTSFFCEECGEADGQPIPFASVSTAIPDATSYYYTGSTIKPGVTVCDSEGNKLKAGRDYTIKYINAVVPGTATAQVVFCGNYEGTFNVNYKIVLPATKKVSFASNTSTIKISWEKVTGASGYKVYYKVAGGWKALGNTTGTSATFSNLPAGKKYTFAVRTGLNKNGKVYWGEYNTVDTVTTSAAPAKVVAAQNTSAIKLTWSAVKGAETYAVLLKTSSGWKTLGFTKNTTATFSNLKSGTNYIYAVRSINLTAGGTVIGGGYIQITTATKPVTPPISVTTSGGKVTVKWTGVQGASGYQVYYKSASSGGFVLLGTTKAGVTTFTDSGYTAGTNYVFAVRATKAVQGGYIYSAVSQKTVTMK